MNILPKKRWHVRTKQNIERVRRDEAKAAEEEKEQERRIQLAEQEARTEFLRKRARPLDDKSEKSSNSSYTEEKHINFFSDIEEAGRYLGGINKEHEAENKAEKEKFEKRIGLLTYLGQSSVEAADNAPWYLESRNKRAKHEESETSETSSISCKQKSLIDPLNDIRRYLDEKQKKDKDRDPSAKSDKKGKHSSNIKIKCRDASPEIDLKPAKTIDQLRAERLKREKQERERARLLIAKHRQGKSAEETVEPVDDRQRRYNSQFNPHLARQSQLKTDSGQLLPFDYQR